MGYTYQFNGVAMRTTPFLVVDGVQMPAPSKLGVSYYDLAEESYRDANGLLHNEFVRFDVHKLHVQWGYLSLDEQHIILNAGRGKHNFPVKFFDPLDKEFVTITAYRGDRETSMYTFDFELDFADFDSFPLNYIEV